jgi:hypothetical protein
MYEALLTVQKKANGGGPGPKTLAAGDATNGFYGEVAAADLFTATELATLTGANAYGTTINDTTPWLKCSLDGNVVYLPKKPIRHSMTWFQIDALKMRTKAQDKQVSKDGLSYRVRSMSGVGSTWTGVQGEDPPGCSDSEYNRLIYRLCVLNPPSETPPVLGSYTLDDLGLTLGPGCCLICQEGGNTYVQRNGGGNATNTNSWHSLQSGVRSDLSDQYRGWRPILELL